MTQIHPIIHRSHRPILLTLLSFACALACSQAFAKKTEAPADAALQDIERTNALGTVHHVNQLEIHLAQLALDKGGSKAVKDYAQHMIEAHKDADKKVVDLGKTMGLSFKDFQAGEQEAAIEDKLKALSGPAFDTAYLTVNMGAHKTVARDFELARTDAKDAEIKQLFSTLIPTVKSHEKMATDALKDLKGASTKTPSTR